MCNGGVGEMNYVKLDGKRNTSDMLTKPVERETINRHMEALGMEFREGRNQHTPAFDGRADGAPKEK